MSFTIHLSDKSDGVYVAEIVDQENNADVIAVSAEGLYECLELVADCIEDEELEKKKLARN